MRKFLVILILAAILTSCSLPGLKPQPTVDYVATQVSLALTTFPTATLPPALPSSTTAPTNAPQSTPTLEPTPTLIIPSSTPQPSATSAPTDPLQSLGSPSWQDTFDNGAYWGLDSSGYSDDYTAIKVENGSLVLTSKTSTGWQGWRISGKEAGDAYIEAAITTASCSGGDTYGLILRAPDYTSGHGYYLELTCSGKYALSVWDSSSSRKLVDFTDTSFINSGSSQTNRIGIWMQGSTLKLFANGSLLTELTDNSITGSGHLGFFIAAYQTPGFSYSVSDLSLWNLP